MSKANVNSTTVTGRPAQEADKLANAALLKEVSGALTLAAFTGLIALLLFLAPDHPVYVVGEIALGVGILWAAKIYAAGDQEYHKARAIGKAEREVAGILARSGVSELAHSTKIQTGEIIGHLALGPCAAVIKTYPGTGRVTYESNIFKVGRRQIPGDPLKEIISHATSLSALIGVEVSPIICVPGMTHDPFMIDGVTICSSYHIQRAIRTLPPAIDAFRARAFISSLPEGAKVKYRAPRASILSFINKPIG